MTTGISRAREWLGLPRLAGRRQFVTAVLVDSLGSGIFLPFSVIYFLRSTSLTLTTVGTCLSIAALVAMATIPVFGPLLDRFGAGAALAASNVVQAAGFFGYLFVDSAWQLTIGAVAVNAGQNLYWTASGPAVLTIAGPDERDRWFSLMRALRNIGLGAGTLLSAVAAAVGGTTVGHFLVVVNGISFLVAAALVISALPMSAPVRTQLATDKSVLRRADSGVWRGYMAVLRDLPFVAVSAANVLLALCTMVMPVILAVYVTDSLRLPGWFAGALFTTNAVLIAGTQTVTSKYLQHLRPFRILQLSALLWALCFAGFWLAETPAPGTAMVLIGAAVLLFTAAEMAHAPTVSGVVGRMAPEDMRGRYFAVLQLSWTIPTALAPSVFTWLFQLGPAWLWAAMLIACLISIVLLRPATGPK